MGKAKKSRAVRVKFAQTKRLLSPKDCRLKANMEGDEAKRKKVGTTCYLLADVICVHWGLIVSCPAMWMCGYTY